MTCLNGDTCPNPHCPDHWPYDLWRPEYWPVVADTDPWWDGLQSQAEHRRMMLYFDIRGGTLNG